MSHKEYPGVKEDINHDPIQFLKKEHEEVLWKLESAKRALQSLRGLPESTVPQQREAEEAWIKDFVVSLVSGICLHFKKEEEALFPTLAEYIGKEHGPIEVMLDEHEALRLAFRDWEGRLVHFCEIRETDKQGTLNAVVATGEEALCLFRQHISKENQILFEICEASLSKEEKKEVAERIKAIDIGCAKKT